jgi:hypothetical protein
MFVSQRLRSSIVSKRSMWLSVLIVPLGLSVVLPLKGDVVPSKGKQIIGATATITELTTGLPFAARIDTGAATCSIHAIKWEIEDRSRRPSENVGKPIRVLIKNQDGDEQWIETKVAGRVRIRNSALDDDHYHGRYKIKLPLEWNGFKKDVLVTINDRTEMQYPLLIGRNYLKKDFLVDVDIDGISDEDEDEQ